LKSNEYVMVLDLGSSVDTAFMNMLSTAVLEKFKIENGHCGLMLLLTIMKDPEKDEGSFLLTGDVSLVGECGKRVAELFNGKGGGKEGRFQGKGTSIRSRLDQAKKLLLEVKQGS